MTVLYLILFALFGLLAGFVVGSSGLVGIWQGLIVGAIAGALLTIPVRSSGHFAVAAIIVAVAAGSCVAVSLSDKNTLKQACGKLGLKITIGSNKSN